jgi:hypothetical protein
MGMMNSEQKIEALLHIPANERCFGHFQVAMQEILRDLQKRLADLERQQEASK